MARSFRFLLAVVVVVGLVIGVGIGMWQRNSGGTPSLVQTANQTGSFGAARGTASPGGQALPNGQGMALGLVQSMDGKSLVMATNSGTTKIILADGVKIYKSSTITADQIKVGDSVSVMSRTDQDGKAAGVSVETGSADALAAMPNVRGFQNGSPAAQATPGVGSDGRRSQSDNSSAQGQTNSGQQGQQGQVNTGSTGVQVSNVSGTVDAISATEITIKVADGTTTKIAISDQTVITKVEEAAADELKVGVNVRVTGKAGDDGTITASSIRLVTGLESPRGNSGVSTGTPSGDTGQSR